MAEQMLPSTSGQPTVGGAEPEEDQSCGLGQPVLTTVDGPARAADTSPPAVQFLQDTAAVRRLFETCDQPRRGQVPAHVLLLHMAASPDIPSEWTQTVAQVLDPVGNGCLVTEPVLNDAIAAVNDARFELQHPRTILETPPSPQPTSKGLQSRYSIVSKVSSMGILNSSDMDTSLSSFEGVGQQLSPVDVPAMENRIAQLEHCRRALQEERDEEQLQLQQLEEANVQLLAAVSRLGSENASLTGEHKRVVALRAECERLQLTLEAETQEKAAQEEQALLSERLLTAQQQEIDQLSQKLLAAHTDARDALEHKRSLLHTVDELRKECCWLRQDLDDRDDKESISQRAIASLHGTIREMRDTSLTLQEEKVRYTSELSSVKKQLKSLRDTPRDNLQRDLAQSAGSIHDEIISTIQTTSDGDPVLPLSGIASPELVQAIFSSPLNLNFKTMPRRLVLSSTPATRPADDVSTESAEPEECYSSAASNSLESSEFLSRHSTPADYVVQHQSLRGDQTYQIRSTRDQSIRTDRDTQTDGQPGGHHGAPADQDTQTDHSTWTDHDTQTDVDVGSYQGNLADRDARTWNWPRDQDTQTAWDTPTRNTQTDRDTPADQGTRTDWGTLTHQCTQTDGDIPTDQDTNTQNTSEHSSSEHIRTHQNTQTDWNPLADEDTQTDEKLLPQSTAPSDQGALTDQDDPSDQDVPTDRTSQTDPDLGVGGDSEALSLLLWQLNRMAQGLCSDATCSDIFRGEQNNNTAKEWPSTPQSPPPPPPLPLTPPLPTALATDYGHAATLLDQVMAQLQRQEAVTPDGFTPPVPRPLYKRTSSDGALNLSHKSRFCSMPTVEEDPDTEMPQHSPLRASFSLPCDPCEVGVFPSLTEHMLAGLQIEADENANNTNEKDLESKFSSLALAFKTDRLTLHERLDVQRRHRDQAEYNLELEAQNFREQLMLLNQPDGDRSEQLKMLQRQLEIIKQISQRLSRTAEVLGAAQQELRVSRAVEVMTQHVEGLRHLYEREHAELTEARRVLATNNIALHEPAATTKAGPPGRRRASIAVFSARPSATLPHAVTPPSPSAAPAPPLVRRRRNSLGAGDSDGFGSITEEKEDEPEPDQQSAEVEPSPGREPTEPMCPADDDDELRCDAEEAVSDELASLRSEQEQLANDLKTLLSRQRDAVLQQTTTVGKLLWDVAHAWPYSRQQTVVRARYCVGGLFLLLAVMVLLVPPAYSSCSADRRSWYSWAELLYPHLSLHHIRPPPL